VIEIHRKNSNKEYTKDNCVISCYWCNNAKTDGFTYEEVGEVWGVGGEGVREFVKSVLLPHLKQ
jgi:hypothetical protein